MDPSSMQGFESFLNTVMSSFQMPNAAQNVEVVECNPNGVVIVESVQDFNDLVAQFVADLQTSFPDNVPSDLYLKTKASLAVDEQKVLQPVAKHGRLLYMYAKQRNLAKIVAHLEDFFDKALDTQFLLNIQSETTKNSICEYIMSLAASAIHLQTVYYLETNITGNQHFNNIMSSVEELADSSQKQFEEIGNVMKETAQLLFKNSGTPTGDDKDNRSIGDGLQYALNSIINNPNMEKMLSSLTTMPRQADTPVVAIEEDHDKTD